MPFLGKTPAQGFANSVTKDDFTPNGSTTAFTLSKQVISANDIEVYVGNVRQEPTSAYSVSGTTLTMTEAPATNTNFYVMHVQGTIESQTVLPGDSIIPSMIQSDAVTTAKIPNNAVTTAKIPNNAVTPAKVSSNLGRRNLVINGAMQVAQRGTTKTWGQGNAGFGSVDRYKFYNQGGGNQEFVVSQETDAPAGFQYSTKIRTNVVDASPPAAQYTISRLGLIEVQNTYPGGWGTSGAKPHALSFWVKSSKTGNQTIAIARHGTVQRSIYKTLTINSADTWEYKTFLIEADTDTTVDMSTATQNANHITIDMYINAGSDYKSTSYPQTTWASRSGSPGPGAGLAKDCLDLADTANAYFQITGVQFEVGSHATEFEHLSFAEDLRLCHRYFRVIGPYGNPRATGGNDFFLVNVMHNNENRLCAPYFETPFRSTPSITLINHANGGTGALTEFSSGTIRSQTSFSEIGINGGGYPQFNGNFGNPARWRAEYYAEL